MADEIVAIYRAEVEQYRKQVESLIQKDKELDAAQKQVGKTAETEFTKGGKAAQTMGSGIQSLTGQLKTMAGALGVAFSLDAVISFGKEVVGLAAKAEGVERAFKRVGSPQLLQGLRDATRGTVTDLVLMQNAVKASNFDIPLENLASLFAFAQARARETGESVDYLVDSIILGIGRKSPLILDNLGISAVALREKFKGISTESASVGQIAQAVGEIATEAMAEMGVQADTTADKIAKITAELENLKVEAGKQLVSVANALFGDERAFETQVKGTIEYATAIRNAGQIIRDDYERTLRVVEGRADREKVLAEEAKVRETQLANLRTQLSNKTSKEVIEDEKMREFLLTKAIENAVGLDIINRRSAKENLRIFNEDRKNRITQVGVLQEQIRTIENLGKVQAEESVISQEQIKNVFYYTQAIKALNTELEAEGTTRERIKKILKEIPPLQEELARLLGEESEATKKAREEVEKLAQAEEDRWKALEAQADDRLKKHFEVDQFIADRTARGLREQMELDKQAEVIKGANAEATALSIGMSEEHILAIRQASIDEQLRIEADYRAKIQEMEDESVDATVKAEAAKNAARKDAQMQTVELVQATLSAVADIYSSLNQIAQNSANAELAILQKKYDEGQISAEQFEQEQIRIQRESAQRAKEAATFNAIIGASQAAINALSSPGVPFPVALAFSLLAVATAAAQIAAIQSTPLPQFAEGGWVDAKGRIHGRKHAQGGVHIEAEGDEFIVKGAMAKQYPNIIEAVNDGTIMRLIKETYVAPAVNAAMFNGFQDIGRSADLNGLTANLKDHNIIAALDRSRQANTYGFAMLAEQLSKNAKVNRRKQW